MAPGAPSQGAAARHDELREANDNADTRKWGAPHRTHRNPLAVARTAADSAAAVSLGIGMVAVTMTEAAVTWRRMASEVA